MAERRSLVDAMDMTPEKMAFIKGQPVKEPKLAPVESPTTKATVEKTIELEATKLEPEPQREPRSRTGRRPARIRSGQEGPEASELLDQVLVPVTIRLQHRTAQTLRRAYLEQRLKHAKPDTQQKIVEEAIGDWLFRQGFLE